jgi:hypothetical protein
VTGRRDDTAALLDGSTVLVVGGWGDITTSLDSVELLRRYRIWMLAVVRNSGA